MEKPFLILLVLGLILGGYTCNPATEEMSEELTSEELETEYGSIGKEVIEEGNQYEKQNNFLRTWREAETDILEEDLGD